MIIASPSSQHTSPTESTSNKTSPSSLPVITDQRCALMESIRKGANLRVGILDTSIIFSKSQIRLLQLHNTFSFSLKNKNILTEN